MNIPNWVRQLTYNANLVMIARMLHLNRFLRDIYCRLAFPKNKKICLSFGEIQAQFHVNTPVELRMIEAPLEKGMGEYYVLEKLLKAIRPGDMVYDIGASLGTHTIFMAKKVGENGSVVAIEPESKSFETLNLNIELNNLKNVLPFKIALGESFYDGVLYNYGGGFGSFNLNGKGTISYSEKIRIVTGDFLVQNKNLLLPKIIKIDVEGYEYSVIMGLKKTLSNKACQMVCCEIHPKMLPADINQKMVLELLDSYGFHRIETNPRGETFHVFCYKS